MDTDDRSPLPGMEHRDAWVARQGKSKWTGKRWQDDGRIVVRYIGRTPYIDLEATAARMRGEDRPARRRRGDAP
jgi:hypothetical protein